ncbi:MAG: DEAD/DEAH box helicase [Blastocatellales bacterium]
MTTLSFDQGTLLLDGLDEDVHQDVQKTPPGFIRDERVGAWRAEAYRYRDAVLWLRRQKIPFVDCARQYNPEGLQLQPRTEIQLYDYQQRAVAAWRQADQRGIVVLPTGAGKTIVALEVIRATSRPTLVVAPTIDLLNQWHKRLTEAFGIEIGFIGQGVCDLRELTVITYHSAYLRMAEIGGRFGLLIFDEVHHLIAPEWTETARLAIAPFRLGLTATYDPRQSEVLNELVGPLAYWKPVRELSGTRLAPYEVVRLSVDLSPGERNEYEREETIYLEYWQKRPDAQSDEKKIDSRLEILLREQARDVEARRAIEAWYQMRRIIANAEAKLDLLEELFRRHASDRTVVFTATNETAYRISQLFLVPAITHRTNANERKTILRRFESGQYKAVVTSKVLNEGVDMPEAAVAIILGGSGSAREHTQRLGRILRQRANKQAVLYEITARGTMETAISRRRRQTEAYAGRARRVSQL